MKLSPVIEALLDPKSYPDPPAYVELKQTHISYLFFIPDRVYKIKKPVDFGFLNFTTLDKRRHFCQQEVILNRRLCPNIYLNVVEIKQAGKGINIGGEGRAVECAVEMKRLPKDRMMDIMIDRGEIKKEMIREAARVIATFHLRNATNGRISSFGSPEAIERNVGENFSQTEGYIGQTITRDEYNDIIEYTGDFLREKRPVFLKRMAGGMIKDCHGDIHSEHVCFSDGVMIFDCIEFNERFRYIDVISDIAFLAMDLDFHHRHDLSNLLCEEYQRLSGGDDGLFTLLNFYKSYRAYIRGKVEGFELNELEIPPEEKERVYHRAGRFFRLAHDYAIGGPKPLLVVICGLIGTGKSTISKTLGQRTGALVISSDITRKGLARIPLTERHYEGFDKGIYSEEFTEGTYKEMFARAESFLKKGNNIIIDATFSKRRQRSDIVKVAKRLNIRPVFVECTCPERIIRERLEKRGKEDGIISDGRWKIYPLQKRRYEAIEEVSPSGHIVADTSQPVERNIRLLLDRI